MEPILAKADNYSFLKKLVENVKETRDAQAPDDEEVNKVKKWIMFACIVATSYNHLVQHNKQFHRTVLLNSFHLICHTLGFHPQTQKLEPPCAA